MKKNKERLDMTLLQRGIATDVSNAQALILSKDVKVDGSFVTQAGQQFYGDAAIELRPKKQFVSRGGIKLQHALKKSEIVVFNKNCLDIGVSTGGFTDCLLQLGALKVIAVDVGYGQTADRIRNHEKVHLLERTNARYLETLDSPVDLAVVDVSFISLLKIIPNILKSLKPKADIFALIKPQFELPKNLVERGGVVTSHLLHAKSVAKIVNGLLNYNLQYKQLIQSPIRGVEGNREFFVWMRYEK